MALKVMFVVIAIVAAILPNAASAMKYVVGDDQGWSLKGNYTAWAEGKEFFVGDSLVFKYKPGSHNVYKVSGPEFQTCQVANGANQAPLTSGNDVVPIVSPGRKWYLCGVPGHCDAGMKLLITVSLSSSSVSPSPSPPQTAAATTVFPSALIFFSATFALLMKVAFA